MLILSGLLTLPGMWLIFGPCGRGEDRFLALGAATPLFLLAHIIWCFA